MATVYRANAPTMPSEPGLPERRGWCYLKRWCTAAKRTRIPAIVELGRSNSRLEGINAKIRLDLRTET